MVRRFATLCIAFAFVPVLLVSGALPSNDTRTPNVRGGTLGIDDELNDIQSRIISGFASFTLGKNGNDIGSSHASGSPSAHTAHQSGRHGRRHRATVTSCSSARSD